VLQQIEADGFEFEHPLYKKVLDLVKQTIENMAQPDENLFLHNEDQELVAFAADILTEKYRISPHWEEKFEIFITDIKDNYHSDADSVLLHLKLKKIDVLMQQNLEEMKQLSHQQQQPSLPPPEPAPVELPEPDLPDEPFGFYDDAAPDEYYEVPAEPVGEPADELPGAPEEQAEPQPEPVDGQAEEQPAEPADEKSLEEKTNELLQKHMMFLTYRKHITELLGATIVK